MVRQLAFERRVLRLEMREFFLELGFGFFDRVVFFGQFNDETGVDRVRFQVEMIESRQASDEPFLWSWNHKGKLNERYGSWLINYLF